MINDMKAPRVVETITRFEMMEVATFVLKGNNQKKKVAEDIYKQGEWIDGTKKKITRGWNISHKSALNGTLLYSLVAIKCASSLTVFSACVSSI